MTRISFNSSVNAIPYAGLMATFIFFNPEHKESAVPIPLENHRTCAAGIYPDMSENLLQDYSAIGITPSYNVESLILGVIASITGEPTDLDLEMANMLNYDVWELF